MGSETRTTFGVVRMPADLVSTATLPNVEKFDDTQRIDSSLIRLVRTKRYSVIVQHFSAFLLRERLFFLFYAASSRMMTVSCRHDNLLDHVLYEWDTFYSYPNVFIPGTYAAQITERNPDA